MQLAFVTALKHFSPSPGEFRIVLIGIIPNGVKGPTFCSRGKNFLPVGPCKSDCHHRWESSIPWSRYASHNVSALEPIKSSVAALKRLSRSSIQCDTPTFVYPYSPRYFGFAWLKISANQVI